MMRLKSMIHKCPGEGNVALMIMRPCGIDRKGFFFVAAEFVGLFKELIAYSRNILSLVIFPNSSE